MFPRCYHLRAMKKTASLHPEHMLVRSFERHLRAERYSESTIAHYCGSATQFARFLEDEHLSLLSTATRADVETWLVHLNQSYRPASVKNRHQGLTMFYRWMIEEGEVSQSPIAKVKPPQVEESPKDVVSQGDMLRVLAHLEKQKRWRDAAMIAVLYDTGMRATELASRRTDELDMETGILQITAPTSKGKRARLVHLSPKALRYIDRYQRRRKDDEFLFSGPRGKLTRSGVYWAVRRCFEEIGVTATIGAHDMRHTSASHVAEAGVLSESEAMTLYGWKDPDMWRLYTAQARERAAVNAHQRASPLERLTRG